MAQRTRSARGHGAAAVALPSFHPNLLPSLSLLFSLAEASLPRSAVHSALAVANTTLFKSTRSGLASSGSLPLRSLVRLLLP